MTLTKKQRDAARQLLAIRPAVIDGTRAIVIRAHAIEWHRKVHAKMEEVGISTAKGSVDQVNAFCDLAGVAD